MHVNLTPQNHYNPQFKANIDETARSVLTAKLTDYKNSDEIETIKEEIYDLANLGNGKQFKIFARTNNGGEIGVMDGKYMSNAPFKINTPEDFLQTLRNLKEIINSRMDSYKKYGLNAHDRYTQVERKGDIRFIPNKNLHADEFINKYFDVVRDEY